METLFGFRLDFWDYATFVVLFLLVMSALAFLVWLAGLPGRIAIARKHPDAEAVKVMGYAGFLTVVAWLQAFIWAFKPTDIVDIRRFPNEEAKGIDEELDHAEERPIGQPHRPPSRLGGRIRGRARHGPRGLSDHVQLKKSRKTITRPQDNKITTTSKTMKTASSWENHGWQDSGGWSDRSWDGGGDCGGGERSWGGGGGWGGGSFGGFRGGGISGFRR